MSRLLVLVLILVAVGDPPSAPVKKDLDALQGQWKVTWVEREGQKVEGQEPIFTLRGKKWFIGKEEEAVLEIDPTCDPKVIDFIASAPGIKGAKTEGIYKIEGDKMVWCLDVADGVKNRPLEFRTKPGSDRVVMWLTRVKTNEQKKK